MKTILLITGTENTREVLHNQLKEYVGHIAYVKSYAIDTGIDKELKGDLIVFSSNIVHEEFKNLLQYKDFLKNHPEVIGKRSINYSEIDKLLFLPAMSEVLFVNDVKETTISCIENLMDIDINHVKYNPYYPGIKEYVPCEIAVTPGEVDKVPSEVKTIIDIGARPFDMSTLVEIMNKLGCYDDRVADVSIRYARKIIELGKKLATKNNECIEINDNISKMMGGFGIQGPYQKNGSALIKHNSKIENLNSNNVNKDIRRDILKKRYFAKYTFNNIVGSSNAIAKTKEYSLKLAKTDLTVLIVGESGTGKELFASAIHNASKRKNGPFLAVNFSALTESLVESELFGYEDGSFTGARKGGKIGIFEQADGGTIFLDEIGDASMVVQARLLRVLQEKEIMRIGGNRIIPVDIRIISATNKNLPKLISEGKFREDLYYRLKLGYIMIPPLRDRISDIGEIAKAYTRKNSKNLCISPRVIDYLYKRQWKGNVRELTNTLEYAAAVCEGSQITIDDLPYDIKEDFNLKENADFNIGCYNSGINADENTDKSIKIILSEIIELQNEGKLIGRKMISERLMERGLNLTEGAVRTKLDKMEREGLIIKGRGKIGTRITDKGMNLIAG